MAGVKDDTKREDCRILVKILKRATGATPKMWGASMVGFGSIDLKVLKDLITKSVKQMKNLEGGLE